MKRLLYVMIPICITLIALLSCDIGGFQDLAELIDPNSPIGTNSYSFLHATTADGNNVTIALTYNEPDGSGNGEFVLTVVVDDVTDVDNKKTEIYMVRTTYNLAGSTMTHTPYFAYHNTYKAGLGNASQDDDPAKFSSIVPDTYLNTYANGGISFDNSSLPVTLTYAGDDFTSFATLHDNIMSESTDAERAKQFMHMYELTIITSQTKIEGFGGLGMLQYIGRTVAFNGIRAGTFELTSSGTFSNTSDFNFKDCSDYQGMKLQGLQRSSSNRDGNGNMTGTVTFTLQGTSQTWTGTVNYDTIVLQSTLPVDGDYLIKFDGIDVTGIPVDPLLTTNPGSFDYSDIFTP